MSRTRGAVATQNVIRWHICVRCRFDLRGHPPIGTCPECGQRYKPGEFIAEAVRCDPLMSSFRRAGWLAKSATVCVALGIAIASLVFLLPHPRVLAATIVFSLVFGVTYWVQAKTRRRTPPLLLISSDEYGIHQPRIHTAMRWSRALLSLSMVFVFWFIAPQQIMPELLVVFGSIACMVFGITFSWNAWGQPYVLAGRVFFLHPWQTTTRFEIEQSPGRIHLQGDRLHNETNRTTISQSLALSDEDAEVLANFIRQRCPPIRKEAYGEPPSIDSII